MAEKTGKNYGQPIFGTVTDIAPVAKTANGIVQGENRNGIAIFRGIPYGGACNGDRRFLPPQPADDWIGVKDCTRNGYYAVQFGTSISASEGFGEYFSAGRPELFGVAEEQQSENCLVLDVLTPGIDGQKRPVLVYIHGGGFGTGSGTLVLGADRLAREEDLVIVGINHRLNVFGYLYLGAFDEKYAQSGMAGMLDLVLALEWVRDNIANFGGDPEQVTIMGESGGGMKVSTLLAMKNAKGLFSKAIVESGSNIIAHVSADEGTQMAKQLLKELGIMQENWKELLSLPAQDILKASDAVGGNAMSFMPVADGICLDYRPEPEFIAPKESKKIPLLIGASEDEMGAFLPTNEMEITWENIREKLLEDSERGPSMGDPLSEENVDRVIAVFRETDRKNNSPLHLYLKIRSQCSFLGSGAYYQAEAKARQGGAPVYHYMIAYDAPHPQRPEEKYSWHTADLPLQMRVVLHEECEAMSRLMAHSWAAFIRTGNPSTEQLAWPAFTPEEKQVMVFDDESRVETDPMRKVREVIYG